MLRAYPISRVIFQAYLPAWYRGRRKILPKSSGRTVSEGNSANWNKWILVVPIHSYCRRYAWYIICSKKTSKNITNGKNLLKKKKKFPEDLMKNYIFMPSPIEEADAVHAQRIIRFVLQDRHM